MTVEPDDVMPCTNLHLETHSFTHLLQQPAHVRTIDHMRIPPAPS